jgi:hypothetical protein
LDVTWAASAARAFCDKIHSRGYELNHTRKGRFESRPG